MHEAFRIDHSSYVHRAFTVYFAFAVRSRSAFAHRSPNSVLRSHTVRSACAHLSSGKVKHFRDCILMSISQQSNKSNQKNQMV